MRIAFFTQDEAIFLAPMLDQVLSACREHECRVDVFRRPGAGTVRDLWWAARTFGIVYTIRTGAEYLCCRLLDAAERLGVLRPRRVSSVGAAARRHGVPVVRWAGSPNAPEVVAALRAFAPDLLVSIACPRVLDQTVLAVPRVACLNVHGGRLPAYRGMHSAFWQLYRGEATGATTVHVMAPEVDAGPIVSEEPWTVDPADTWHDVMRKSRAAGVPALIRALAMAQNGGLDLKPNDPRQGARFGKPSREHVRRLRARGVRLR
ncbi:MAG TPA: formyltransferase family protein [Gemmatimonadales bacterium]|nr:formyltransferase family protein [Gemmatimonadales bacterium]